MVYGCSEADAREAEARARPQLDQGRGVRASRSAGGGGAESPAHALGSLRTANVWVHDPAGSWEHGGVDLGDGEDGELRDTHVTICVFHVRNLICPGDEIL